MKLFKKVYESDLIDIIFCNHRHISVYKSSTLVLRSLLWDNNKTWQLLSRYDILWCRISAKKSIYDFINSILRFFNR